MSRILQPGETGFGILIEHDAGFIDVEDNRELIRESFEPKIGEPIIINCILQKWGVKNKNGRIYPKDILIAQVNEYMKMVETNSAPSEADHPDCVSASESMICTKEGWKSFEEISNDEEILTLNLETNKIEPQKITKKIYEPYKGKMYRFTSNNLNLTVTPNHRFLIENYKGERFFETAENIYENVNNIYDSGKYKILKQGDWVGEEYDEFILPGVDDSMFDKKIKKTLKLKYSEPLKINAEDWFAFLGLYFSDGHCTGVKSNKYKLKGYNVAITQKKEKHKDKIEGLLDRLPFKINKAFYFDNKIQYNINDARLYEYLFKYGYSLNKHIPTEIKNASKKLLSIFFEWFLIGDGRDIKDKDKKNTDRKSVFSTSKKLIYDLHEILLKTGGSGNITINQHNYDRKIVDKKIKKEIIINDLGEEIINDVVVETERTILEKNSNPIYNLNVSKTKHIYIDKRALKIETIDFDDTIACVNVPNGNFLVSVNGKTHWTGNSSIVSLLNISHLLKKMWWGKGDKENILYGEIDLVVSPGFLKYGIVSVVGDKILLYLKNYKMRLGISSRGVGSLKEVNGENFVQDDFELIAFDLVATPSTPGAFLYPDSEGFNINEYKKNNEGLYLKEEKKIKAFDKFLN